uniref:Integron gene cassette protein n=1 Tax=Macrostomum lignano TaxID=282301 RepID=A0A1I8F707_9PLAT
ASADRQRRSGWSALCAIARSRRRARWQLPEESGRQLQQWRAEFPSSSNPMERSVRKNQRRPVPPHRHHLDGRVCSHLAGSLPRAITYLIAGVIHYGNLASSPS